MIIRSSKLSPASRGTRSFPSDASEKAGYLRNQSAKIRILAMACFWRRALPPV